MMGRCSRFQLGNIVATADILNLYGAHHIDLGLLFDRHTSGDWGDVSSTTSRNNNRAIHKKEKLTSVYTFSDYQIRIVTGEHHRCTTVSLLEMAE